MKHLHFQMPVLAVKDVSVSRKFYTEVFGQAVVCDLGKNLTFSGGFAIQEDFAWLTGVDPTTVTKKSHNMELYFEVQDFDAFYERLQQFPELEYVHAPKMHEWKQRVVRIYDPDHHMIEIGESMEVIAKRYLAEGFSVEETARVIQHPVAFVKACLSEES